jgi:hypothetical protein
MTSFGEIEFVGDEGGGGGKRSKQAVATAPRENRSDQQSPIQTKEAQKGKPLRKGQTKRPIRDRKTPKIQEAVKAILAAPLSYLSTAPFSPSPHNRIYSISTVSPVQGRHDNYLSIRTCQAAFLDPGSRDNEARGWCCGDPALWTLSYRTCFCHPCFSVCFIAGSTNKDPPHGRRNATLFASLPYPPFFICPCTFFTGVSCRKGSCCALQWSVVIAGLRAEGDPRDFAEIGVAAGIKGRGGR